MLLQPPPQMAVQVMPGMAAMQNPLASMQVSALVLWSAWLTWSKQRPAEAAHGPLVHNASDHVRTISHCQCKRMAGAPHEWHRERCSSCCQINVLSRACGARRAETTGIERSAGSSGSRTARIALGARRSVTPRAACSPAVSRSAGGSRRPRIARIACAPRSARRSRRTTAVPPTCEA